MEDLSNMCLKDSYQRAEARLPSCPAGTVIDSISQQCFKSCDRGTASGPMCWQECAPETKACGGALCLDNRLACTDDLREQVSKSLDMIKEQAVSANEGVPFNAGSNFKGQSLPVCIPETEQ